MNKELATLLKNRIQSDGGLEFIDVYSGLVQTVSRRIEDENGNPKTQRFPVSYDTNIVDCGRSPEKALTPDSTKKGLIYFEEVSPVSIGRRTASGFYFYRSNINLVAWLNRKKITGDVYSEISKKTIERILAKLSDRQETEVGFINVQIKPESIRQDATIFSRYTYDEEVTQYLRPPFEFFAISLSVSFYSKIYCEPELNISEIKC